MANLEMNNQEKFQLVISADGVTSTDKRFTMDNLSLGDNYKPLGAIFRNANGEEIKRKLNKGERRVSCQTLPRIACQIFEKELASLSVEEKEAFPICRYAPNMELICGIYSGVDEFRRHRNTIEYVVYRYDAGRQFVFYCWNLFSTVIFAQECLKRFGRPGEQFVLTYREKNEKEMNEKKESVPEAEPVQNTSGYNNPYSSMLLESKNLIFRGAPGTGKSYLAKEIAADIVSDGFRPGRSCQQAIEEALVYLNEGYEWVIDLDIEKYFDTVNHDKLISILRERINDAKTLRLVRQFLQAGVMENGLISPSKEGVPQGGPLSPILSNVYLDKLDQELEARGLHFVRYADDCNIFVKSEMAADRVMKSVTSWLERKLRLKVSATKTKVVRPTKSNFLGFTFWKSKDGWKCKPANDRKKRLYAKTRAILCRRKAVARPMKSTFEQLNWLIRGWINYYRIGSMKIFLEEYGQWLRHKVRVVILKQWKKSRRIYLNLQKLNQIIGCGFTHEEIFKVANSRLGWYRRSGMYVVNFAISPEILGRKTKSRPGLVDPLQYYLSNI